MGAQRSTPPRPGVGLAEIQVDDPKVRQALNEVADAIRALQTRPAAVTVDGRRSFKLGGDQAGDLYMRGRDGSLTRIAPGSPGDVLTIGADGLPAWV